MTIDAASVFGAAASDPLFGLGFTLVIYQGASWLQRRCGGLVLLNRSWFRSRLPWWS
jgi:hypothetical protein